MESSTILTADVLDILFEGRNKDYGAYDLRRTYRKRLTMSITVMLSMTCMLFIGFAFAGKKTAIDPVFDTKDVILSTVTPPDKPIELPPPPVKPPAAPEQMKMIKSTTPVLVTDDKIQESEVPPVDAQENVKIGNATVLNGADGDGPVTGPVGDGIAKGVIEQPQKADEDDDRIRLKVEIESEYPGGAMAWQRFLNKNVRYPNQAVEDGIQGPVVVQFIVDKEGNVSDVVAVSGPDELRAEAVRVIKKSGKWTPAIQNGHQVKSYKRQPIVFRLATE
jgi:periplasmic protein TonB